ncbi:MAG TPA: hypothetical protein PLK04_09805 [Bacillota bacterium]|nr:hypothetical protein [Bacillota bacterium]HQD81098.1 hypothetical protein [Bacillota bacterium]
MRVSDIEGDEIPLLVPLLELMYQVRLEDVFVEPITTGSSCFEGGRKGKPHIHWRS